MSLDSPKSAVLTVCAATAINELGGQSFHLQWVFNARLDESQIKK